MRAAEADEMSAGGGWGRDGQTPTPHLEPPSVAYAGLCASAQWSCGGVWHSCMKKTKTPHTSR